MFGKKIRKIFHEKVAFEISLEGCAGFHHKDRRRKNVHDRDYSIFLIGNFPLNIVRTNSLNYQYPQIPLRVSCYLFLSPCPETALWDVEKHVLWWAKSYFHLSTSTFKGRNDKWDAEPFLLVQIKYAVEINWMHTHHSPHCRPPIHQLSPSDNSPQL